eukprot:jgi/Mesvir1/28131/Mv04705-RA.2
MLASVDIRVQILMILSDEEPKRAINFLLNFSFQVENKKATAFSRWRALQCARQCGLSDLIHHIPGLSLEMVENHEHLLQQQIAAELGAWPPVAPSKDSHPAEPPFPLRAGINDGHAVGGVRQQTHGAHATTPAIEHAEVSTCPLAKDTGTRGHSHLAYHSQMPALSTMTLGGSHSMGHSHPSAHLPAAASASSWTAPGAGHPVPPIPPRSMTERARAVAIAGIMATAGSDADASTLAMRAHETALQAADVATQRALSSAGNGLSSTRPGLSDPTLLQQLSHDSYVDSPKLVTAWDADGADCDVAWHRDATAMHPGGFHARAALPGGAMAVTRDINSVVLECPFPTQVLSPLPTRDPACSAPVPVGGAPAVGPRDTGLVMIPPPRPVASPSWGILPARGEAEATRQMDACSRAPHEVATPNRHPPDTILVQDRPYTRSCDMSGSTPMDGCGLDSLACDKSPSPLNQSCGLDSMPSGSNYASADSSFADASSPIQEGLPLPPEDGGMQVASPDGERAAAVTTAMPGRAGRDAAGRLHEGMGDTCAGSSVAGDGDVQKVPAPSCCLQARSSCCLREMPPRPPQQCSGLACIDGAETPRTPSGGHRIATPPVKGLPAKAAAYEGVLPITDGVWSPLAAPAGCAGLMGGSVTPGRASAAEQERSAGWTTPCRADQLGGIDEARGDISEVACNVPRDDAGEWLSRSPRLACAASDCNGFAAEPDTGVMDPATVAGLPPAARGDASIIQGLHAARGDASIIHGLHACDDASIIHGLHACDDASVAPMFSTPSSDYMNNGACGVAASPCSGLSGELGGTIITTFDIGGTNIDSPTSHPVAPTALPVSPQAAPASMPCLRPPTAASLTSDAPEQDLGAELPGVDACPVDASTNGPLDTQGTSSVACPQPGVDTAVVAHAFPRSDHAEVPMPISKALTLETVAAVMAGLVGVRPLAAAICDGVDTAEEEGDSVSCAATCQPPAGALGEPSACTSPLSSSRLPPLDSVAHSGTPMPNEGTDERSDEETVGDDSVEIELIRDSPPLSDGGSMVSWRGGHSLGASHGSQNASLTEPLAVPGSHATRADPAAEANEVLLREAVGGTAEVATVSCNGPPVQAIKHSTAGHKAETGLVEVTLAKCLMVLESGADEAPVLTDAKARSKPKPSRPSAASGAVSCVPEFDMLPQAQPNHGETVAKKGRRKLSRNKALDVSPIDGKENEFAEPDFTSRPGARRSSSKHGPQSRFDQEKEAVFAMLAKQRLF